MNKWIFPSGIKDKSFTYIVLIVREQPRLHRDVECDCTWAINDLEEKVLEWNSKYVAFLGKVCKRFPDSTMGNILVLSFLSSKFTLLLPMNWNTGLGNSAFVCWIVSFHANIFTYYFSIDARPAPAMSNDFFRMRFFCANVVLYAKHSLRKRRLYVTPVWPQQVPRISLT